MKITVIGLGTMGAPMAANLLRASFAVTVHNRTRSREEPLVQLGARSADSPRAAATGADVVLTCVSDTPDMEEVLFASEGAAEGMTAGSLLVDCSTIAPSAAQGFAQQLAERGIGFVDAPVSGGSEGAIQGTLAIMCGASEEDFARALPILEVIGGSITRVGTVGAGQIAKAVNQIIIAGTYQSVAEGITLAARAGIDPARVVEAIENGAASSWVLSNRSENMRLDRYPLGFRLRLHRKDLRIALDEARELGVPMPVASYVATSEDGLIRQGHGDEDMSAIARAVRRAADLPDGPIQVQPEE